jgi:hypothetical protein
MHTRSISRPGVLAALLISTTAMFVLGACPSPELMPLVGEDPEIESILGTSERTQLATSPLAAARRLHQALSQEDFESAWELLATTTRQALDARGAVINASGRELLDASALPTSAGTMRRIRFSSLFFGLDVTDLELVRAEGEDAWVRAVGRDGDARELHFKRDAGLWRLHFTDF